MKIEKTSSGNESQPSCLGFASVSFYPKGMKFTSIIDAENEIKNHGHFNAKTGKLRRKQPTCVSDAIAFLKNEC